MNLEHLVTPESKEDPCGVSRGQGAQVNQAPTPLGWNYMSIKKSSDCTGSLHIVYVKTHEFQMILKNKNKNNSPVTFGAY